jgi:dolichyl-phosphate-mannose-protein mannosyltransferase
MLSWPHFTLFIILAIIICFQGYSIMHTTDMIFDENHYVAEARGIIAGWGPHYTEHPPLGKMFIELGIRLFGDWPLGWRFFSAIFGIGSVVLFYFICSTLKLSRKTQLFATFLFGFDNMNFVQSDLALLDVFSVTFMLAAFLLYLKARYFSSGLAIALAGLAKMTGLLAGLVLFVYWLGTKKRRFRDITLVAGATIVFFIALYPVLHYVLSFTWENPVSLISELLRRSGILTFENNWHILSSKPWQWLINPGMFFYSLDPQYIAAVSPTIWVMILPSVAFMVILALKKNVAALFGVSWFAAAYLPWIPLVLITDRITFIYYFYPVIGAICLGIGMGIDKLLDISNKTNDPLSKRITHITTYIYLGIHMLLFIVLSPVFYPLVKWWPFV